jgi:hypothetical protein
MLSIREIPVPEELENEYPEGSLKTLNGLGFVDLGPYLDGTATQEVPNVAEIWKGRSLFYEGRLNEIHAEPGTGKTNVLMAACILEIALGGRILYIDPEDTPKGFCTRMLMLGASPQDIREHVFYLHNPPPEEIKQAQNWARDHKPRVVVLDGLAESMAAVDLNEDKALDVLKFFRETLRPFAEAGSAVIVADHVTKSTEGRGQFARGSGAKAGRYDGVSYDIVSGERYTPKNEGYVKLKIAKDRNGGAGPRGSIIATLHFIPGSNGRTITSFREPADPQSFRPTKIMEKILKHLKSYTNANKRELRDLGNHRAVDTAVQILMDEELIVMKRKNCAMIYSLPAPPLSSELAHVPESCPNPAQGTVNSNVPTVPPPLQGGTKRHSKNKLKSSNICVPIELITTTPTPNP